MPEKLLKFSQRTIEYSFYLLFFLVPLILTPFNYELFEYNKMMAAYAFTAIIVGAWIIKMISERKFRITRTPLDIPIVLFLISQIVSTLFSMDKHVSMWGYYSRFNGGLLSTASYVLLYYAFVSNFPKEKIFKLFWAILTSGILVSLYGILEHFGIDKDLWVQDVQNRVFSSLGQPNWLAAYLAVLIPITIGLSLNSKFEYRNSKQYQNSNVQNSKRFDQVRLGFENLNLRHLNLFRISDFGFRIYKNIYLLAYWSIGSIFYITLLFTKSRSGFLGIWISLMVFWLINIFLLIREKISSQKTPQILSAVELYKASNKFMGIFILSFIFITFFLGTPFPQINRFTLLDLLHSQQPETLNQLPTTPLGSSIIDVGITESGTIRRIVWKGAIDIFRHYPIFGTGVETFAFAYYKFRPIEHNMTSEWDFLYNKAHNEYLNYAATTGSFGLGSYFLIIVGFIWWNIKKSIKCKKTSEILTANYLLLSAGLFSAWLSILITNFFGFSVVIIQLFFFLIPAIAFILCQNLTPVLLFSSRINPTNINNLTMKQFNKATINGYQIAMILIVLLATFYLLLATIRLWYSDTFFASGYHFSKASDYLSAYQSFKKAIALNSNEPLYYDELAVPAAQLSVVFNEEKQSTYSSYIREEALLASQIAVNISPNNVNFWKTRTRMLYTLAQVDEKYLGDALTALKQAKILSPTDPKVSYNLGLLYDKIGKKEEAIAELIETTRLKSDYRDAYFALGLFYQRDKKKEKAKEAFNFILTRIATDDADAKKLLEEVK